MKPCYIHCGPHKTGSTSLQRGLEKNWTALQARGFFLPELSDRVAAARSHPALTAELPHLAAGNAARTPTWTRLEGLLRLRDETPVLSCEIFSTHFHKTAEVAAVTGFLARLGYRPHFIYYIRDNPAWLNSLYVQAAKRFYTTLDFEAYVEAALAPPKSDAQLKLDYGRMLRHILGNPAADLTVIPFETATRTGLLRSLLMAVGAARPEDVFAARPGRLGALLEAVGARARPDFVEAGWENPNPGVKAVYVGREVASLLAARGLDPRAHRGLYGYLKRTYLRRRWTDEPYCGLDDALAARITARLQPQNDRLAQMLWGKPWAAVIPPRTGFRKARFDAADRPARDVEATLQHLRAMIAAIP